MLYTINKYDIFLCWNRGNAHGMLNGQQIMFKDYNLSLNVTQLKLQRIDSSTADKTISVVLNTAGLVKRYVYNSLYNDLISI